MNFWTSEVRHARFGALTVRGPSGSEMDIPAREDELRASDMVTVGIRPEHIRIGQGEGNTRGRVELVEQLGESHLLYVRTRPDLILTVRAPGDARYAMGQEVVLDLPVEQCHLFEPSGAAIRH